jgi:hypothetical protein
MLPVDHVNVCLVLLVWRLSDLHTYLLEDTLGAIMWSKWESPQYSFW